MLNLVAQRNVNLPQLEVEFLGFSLSLRLVTTRKSLLVHIGDFLKATSLELKLNRETLALTEAFRIHCTTWNFSWAKDFNE